MMNQMAEELCKFAECEHRMWRCDKCGCRTDARTVGIMAGVQYELRFQKQKPSQPGIYLVAYDADDLPDETGYELVVIYEDAALGLCCRAYDETYGWRYRSPKVNELPYSWCGPLTFIQARDV